MSETHTPRSGQGPMGVCYCLTHGIGKGIVWTGTETMGRNWVGSYRGLRWVKPWLCHFIVMVDLVEESLCRIG